MMSVVNNNDISPLKEQELLKYANKKIKAYKRDATLHGSAYFISQILAVSLSAITPVLIVTDVPKVWQALVPAVASIASGLSIYKWRENWASCAITAAKLDAEKTRFDIKATLGGGDIEQFLNKIVAIDEEHLKAWSAEKIVSYWQTDKSKTATEQAGKLDEEKR